MTDKNLNVRAWFGLAAVTIVMGLLIFISAGTTRYRQAWIFLCLYAGTSLLMTVYAMKNDPDLLRRRMSSGPTAEKEGSQKAIMSILWAAFLACLVVPALDFRHGWSHVPVYLVAAGDLLVVSFFYVAFLAFRENSFAAATVEIASGQHVVSTGIYGRIRHPMYAGGLALFIGMPLALGSFWGLLAFPVALPALVWRLLDEERLLGKNLPGYVVYCEKVRWRLVPGIF